MEEVEEEKQNPLLLIVVSKLTKKFRKESRIFSKFNRDKMTNDSGLIVKANTSSIKKEILLSVKERDQHPEEFVLLERRPTLNQEEIDDEYRFDEEE